MPDNESHFRVFPPDPLEQGQADRGQDVRQLLSRRSGSGHAHSGFVGSMSGLPESGHGWAIYEYAP